MFFASHTGNELFDNFLNQHFARVDGASVIFSDLVAVLRAYLNQQGVPPKSWPMDAEVRDALRRRSHAVGYSGAKHLVANLAQRHGRHLWQSAGSGKLRKVTLQQRCCVHDASRSAFGSQCVNKVRQSIQLFTQRG